MPKFSIKNKKILLAIICTFILASCLVFFHLIPSSFIKTESLASSVSSPSFDAYVLSLKKSQVKKEALSFCNDFQKTKAGGYVWQIENYHHIVYGIFLNKNDAVLVQNSLAHENTKSEILSIKFFSVKINGTFNSDEIKILNKALLAPIEYYKDVYDIAISVDTAVYNEISARMAVNNAHSKLSTALENFELIFKGSQDQTILSLSNLLANIKHISQKLCGGTIVNQEQTYSSLLKYRYIEILECYYNFSINFAIKKPLNEN